MTKKDIAKQRTRVKKILNDFMAKAKQAYQEIPLGNFRIHNQRIESRTPGGRRKVRDKLETVYLVIPGNPETILASLEQRKGNTPEFRDTPALEKHAEELYLVLSS